VEPYVHSPTSWHGTQLSTGQIYLTRVFMRKQKCRKRGSWHFRRCWTGET